MQLRKNQDLDVEAFNVLTLNLWIDVVYVVTIQMKPTPHKLLYVAKNFLQYFFTRNFEFFILLVVDVRTVWREKVQTAARLLLFLPFGRCVCILSYVLNECVLIQGYIVLGV